jgi:hypothetical protein
MPSQSTRQVNYVERKIEARSCNYCSSRKAVSITQCECVFVALGIQHAMRVRHIVICDLPHATIFFHIISQNERLSGKKMLFNIKHVTIFYKAIV